MNLCHVGALVALATDAIRTLADYPAYVTDWIDCDVLGLQLTHFSPWPSFLHEVSISWFHISQFGVHMTMPRSIQGLVLVAIRGIQQCGLPRTCECRRRPGKR